MQATKKQSKAARKRLSKWLNSYEDVTACLEKHGDLLELLEAGGGICKIENFLPSFIAEGILDVMQHLDDAQWKVTAASEDYAHNNISHDFLSTKSNTLEAIFRIFTLLLPESLFTFSAAKYCREGHIKPHDDRNYTNVCMEDGSVVLCSRNISVIYYLTKDWTAEDGGALIDLEAPGGPQTHIPKFNSVISFTIPRWHEVTPVVGNRPRYSVFGWFLEPGKLYDLQLDAPPQQQQQHQQQQQQQQQQQEDHQPTEHVSKRRKKKVVKQLAQGADMLHHPPMAAVSEQKPAKKKRKVDGEAAAAAVAGVQLHNRSAQQQPSKPLRLQQEAGRSLAVKVVNKQQQHPQQSDGNRKQLKQQRKKHRPHEATADR